MYFELSLTFLSQKLQTCHMKAEEISQIIQIFGESPGSLCEWWKSVFLYMILELKINADSQGNISQSIN